MTNPRLAIVCGEALVIVDDVGEAHATPETIARWSAMLDELVREGRAEVTQTDRHADDLFERLKQ